MQLFFILLNQLDLALQTLIVCHSLSDLISPHQETHHISFFSDISEFNSN